MKTGYLDTNIIISFIKPNDPFHAEAQEILTKPIIRNISSTLLLVELKSVVSKQLQSLQSSLTDEQQTMLANFTDNEKVEVFYRYLLTKIHLEIVENILTVKETNIMYDSLIFETYATALAISGRTKFRTLDNLHIAHCIGLEKPLNVGIDYFVTGDEELLKRRGIIKDFATFTILSPAELLQLEKKMSD